jgi:N-acyl homoserine lactone hydrolase
MYDILVPGFPGRSSRGFLGWSTIALIATEAGPVLFDTGGAGDRQALLAALARRGIEPAGVAAVVLSHLHFDHVANVECFPGAEVVVHADELSYFEQQGAADPAMPLYLVAGLRAHARLKVVTGEPELARGVTLIRTPGHTAGHCSLVLATGRERVVLAQDAIKVRSEIVAGGPAAAFSLPDARASVARILSLADLVVPGHDCPLRIGPDGPEPLAPIAEAVTLTTDGRVIPLEA